MAEEQIPLRLREAIRQATPEQNTAAASPRRDSKQLLSDVDALLAEMLGSTGAAVPAAQGASAREPLAGETTAEEERKPQPAAEAVSITAELQPMEVAAPAPKPETLRLDLFGAKPEPSAHTPLGAANNDIILRQAAESAADATKIISTPDMPNYERTVERPGVVLRRVDMQMTTDLSPVPKVVPADELLQKQHGAERPAEDIPEGQTRISGFEGSNDTAPQTRSEDELLREVRRSRAEATSQFQALRYLTEKMAETGETGAPPPLPPDVPPETGASAFSYDDEQQRDVILRKLLQTQTRLGLRTALLALLCAAACALLVMGLIQFGMTGADAANAADRLRSPVDAGDTTADTAARFLLPAGQSVPQLLLLLAGLALHGASLLRGLKGVLRRRPNGDTLLLLAGLLCVLQSLLACWPAFGGYSYAPLLLFMAALQLAAKWLRARADAQSFRFCAYRGKGLYALHTGEETVQGNSAAAVAQQRAVLYPAPASFPAGLGAQLAREDIMDKACRWLLPIALGMAAIAGLSGGLLTMDAQSGVTAAAAALCLALPAPTALALYCVLRGMNGNDKASGVAVLGSGAAEDYGDADGVVVDSCDLFRNSKGRMHGWREYWQVRTDEVLLYAAAIAIASGGPLQAVFESVVEGDHSVLPALHDLRFEDKMGLSCWIHNQKVLLGNRKLLENHGVAVNLNERDEVKYERGSRKILYLAIEKRVAAFFVVSYQPEEILAPALQCIHAEGRELLVCNADPTITRALLAEGFALPAEEITMLRAAQTEANRRRMHIPQADAGVSVYHADNIRAYLRAVTACLRLRGSCRRLRMFQVVGSLTAFLLLLLAALTKQLDYANSLVFIAFEGIWAAICYAGAKN
ncbi:MAG: hypothetical protein LBC83_04735 [Oscillospiraceae bacterium]|jgi:hypothetical protein|nr:hypothetical protein [Oscillospiraceae bacterium]